MRREQGWEEEQGYTQKWENETRLDKTEQSTAYVKSSVHNLYRVKSSVL